MSGPRQHSAVALAVDDDGAGKDAVYPIAAGIGLIGLLVTAALFLQLLQKLFLIGLAGFTPYERHDVGRQGLLCPIRRTRSTTNVKAGCRAEIRVGDGPRLKGVAAGQVGGGLGGEGDLLAGVGAEGAERVEATVWGRVVELGFVTVGVVAPHGPAGLAGGDGAELGPEVLRRVGGKGGDPFGAAMAEFPCSLGAASS